PYVATPAHPLPKTCPSVQGASLLFMRSECDSLLTACQGPSVELSAFMQG
ncbi:MAG: hypothetical protein RJA70_4483, partial [Pseudomonadota bacterium]